MEPTVQDPVADPAPAQSAGAAPQTATGAGGATPQPNAEGSKSSGTNFESLALAGFVFGLFAMVIAVFAVGLAARAVKDSGGGGGGGSSAPAESSAEVTLADFSIDPDTLAVTSGATISLVNNGAVQHDLVVDTQASPMLEPGGEAVMELTDVAPGVYDMYCSVPGHREAGMEGTITVE